MNKIKNRPLYLKKLIAFKDSDIVKIVTGIRRCGKSTLLKLMILYLKENGVKDEQIIEMNFESYDFKDMSAEALYQYVKSKVIVGKKMYLFFDELQRITTWEEAINSFRVDFDCDIYITGSNAYLLSSEYSTYLSGRSVEIKMLPLSFKEFIGFNDLTVVEENKLGIVQNTIYDQSGKHYSLSDVFNSYLSFGGMPAIIEDELNQEKAMMLLDGVYSTVVLRDILEREKRRGQKKITDSFLLRKIILFLADNIGSNISATYIGNVLVNEGLLENRKTKPSTHTVQVYVNALLESYVFYEIKRFDIKGKALLRTLGKYYIVDIGLRNYLLGFSNRDSGHILENIVYFELLRRGYDVAVGKIENREIDFIAHKPNERLYIQVTETMAIENVRNRELTSLKMVRDNYEKIVLSLDNDLNQSYDGIKSKNLIDWLLE